MRQTIRYLFVPALALFFTMMLYNWLNAHLFSDLRGKDNQKNQGEVLIGGPFSLTNQDGKVVTDKDFQGKYMLVFFGFTNCPMICPTGMATISKTLNRLDYKEVDKVQPLFITVDPARDNAEQLKSFISNFSPKFQGLTGTPEQIKDVANVYKIYYKNEESKDLQGYQVNHSAYIYLMGPDGKYITHFQSDANPQDIVDTLKKYL